MVRSFVTDVSQPANNRGLARWNRPICVGAVNLRMDVARYVVDRISDVARELEVEAVAEGGEFILLEGGAGFGGVGRAFEVVGAAGDAGEPAGLAQVFVIGEHLARERRGEARHVDVHRRASRHD